MRRFAWSLVAVVLAVGVTAAYAGEGCKKGVACSKSAAVTAKEAEAQTASSKSGCDSSCNSADYCVEASMARAMKILPHMTYKVGDFATPCSKTAQAKSAEMGMPVQYVVAGETYGCKTTAMNKLAGLIEGDVAELAKVCPTVAGEPMHCATTAAKVAAEKHAMMKYSVAGVQFDCPKTAQAVADKLTAKLDELRNDDAVATAASAKSGCASSCTKGAEAKTASSETGSGCSKSCTKGAEAKTASTKSGCPSSCTKGAEVKTASSETGSGCSKSCTKSAEAKTASTKSGCPSSCTKGAEVKTASSETGSGCSKSCTKSAEAKTASTKSGCSSSCTKGTEVQTASATNDAPADEDTEALAHAKLVVRRIVEFVANERAAS